MELIIVASKEKTLAGPYYGPPRTTNPMNRRDFDSYQRNLYDEPAPKPRKRFKPDNSILRQLERAMSGLTSDDLELEDIKPTSSGFEIDFLWHGTPIETLRKEGHSMENKSGILKGLGLTSKDAKQFEAVEKEALKDVARIVPDADVGVKLVIVGINRDETGLALRITLSTE
jgi:hypothetical protein